MRTMPLVTAHARSGLETEAEFTHWVRQIVTGAAEIQAFEAGQIDAVMDASTSSAILSPGARTALRGSNSFVREVLDALPVEACVVDSAGTVIMTNRAWRGFVAASAGAGLGVREGANLFTACNDAAGDERTHAAAVARGFRQVLAGARQEYWREYVCPGHGGYCAFTLTIAPIAADGVMHGLVTRENVSVHKGTDVSRGARQTIAGRIDAVTRAGTPNRILSALPDKDYERMLGRLEPVDLTYGQVLFQPGERIDFVYFPSDCPVSLLTVVDGNRSLEVGLVGCEGMIGTPLALGGTTSSVRALVQGTGTAVRMKSVDFLKTLRRSPDLQRALFRFIELLMIQVAQNAACNCFHLVEERLARWLLMTRERVPSNSFYLTHGLLADMLGTRRESVTGAANALKRRRLINYNRGRITVINQRGLEAAACVCFRQVKTHSESHRSIAPS
jgi:CRP-like cAMP-binding protein